MSCRKSCVLSSRICGQVAKYYSKWHSGWYFGQLWTRISSGSEALWKVKFRSSSYLYIFFISAKRKQVQFWMTFFFKYFIWAHLSSPRGDGAGGLGGSWRGAMDLYRLFSANAWQLLEFWATFCAASNLEQPLPPRAMQLSGQTSRLRYNHKNELNFGATLTQFTDSIYKHLGWFRHSHTTNLRTWKVNRRPVPE